MRGHLGTAAKEAEAGHGGQARDRSHAMPSHAMQAELELLGKASRAGRNRK